MSIADPYQGFSKVFDKVVSGPKYDLWESWITQTWQKYEFQPASLLDLACGTGINSIRFANRGLKVYGIDSSDAMLQEAQRKGSNVTFSRGHFLNFTIPKKVDAAICLDFSANYILRTEEFVDYINRVYDSLNHGGIFIFDYKPTGAFSKKEKHLRENDFSFDWTCDTSWSPFIRVDIETTLNDNGKITHFQERHIERGYTLSEMEAIIQTTRFQLLELCDNCQPKEPTDNSDLVQVILRKD